MVDWSLLPNELVERISTFLDASVDLLRFRSICSSWRSSVSPISPASRLPLFGGLNSPDCVYLSKRTVYLITLPDSTSPCGWLVKISSEEGSPDYLLNPLSRYRLNSLPSDFPRPLDLFNFRILELGEEYVIRVNHFSCSYPGKVVITWLKHGSHFLLLSRDATGILCLFESVAGKEWTCLYVLPKHDDVIAYNEKLYAVDATGKTVRVGPNGELELIAKPIFEGDVKYLVECRGQLLLVNMYDTTTGWNEELQKNPTRYESGRVFKLDEESRSWIAMNCLDDQVLFLGEDSNFSASASDLPGCSGNCIFFMNNYLTCEHTKEEAGVLLGNDIGVFELGSGSIGPLSSYPEYAKMFWPPPDWVSSTSLEEQTEEQLEDSSLTHDDPALVLYAEKRESI